MCDAPVATLGAMTARAVAATVVRRSCSTTIRRRLRSIGRWISIAAGVAAT